MNPKLKGKTGNINNMAVFWGYIFTSGQRVAVLWCEWPWSQLYTPGAGISTRPRISPWSEWEVRRADERRGLTLPFKSLSPAPLTARIDLALPWIHPGRQLERMHKAHYSEHAYSHTCTHGHSCTRTHTHKHPYIQKKSKNSHMQVSEPLSLTHIHLNLIWGRISSEERRRIKMS